MDPSPDSCPSLLLENIALQGETVHELQKALIAARAVGPENGGDGETARIPIIADFLAACGIDAVIRADSPDPRVSSGSRPNLIASVPGKTSAKLWLFAHLDTVDAGDLSAWTTDPFVAARKGDRISGRGAEDNNQAVCSMLVLAGALKTLKLVPPTGLGLVFMADEECGSRHGLRHILAARPDLFSGCDFFIVPDGGSPDGSEIEIAEKAQLWVKFVVRGRQCHASNPFLGRNAFLAAAKFAVMLESGLRRRFSEKNPLFIPPVSTFTPTLHPGASGAVNIMPGKDEFYLDCRLLPSLSIEKTLEAIDEIRAQAEKELRTRIEPEIVQRHEASETPPRSPVVLRLEKAIREEYGVDARPVGIGGGTVAAFLRAAGLPAVVWSCVENLCHQPDESSSIRATLKDAAVFARVLYAEARDGG